MQQLPPFPDDAPGQSPDTEPSPVAPSEPGQPTPAPAETPEISPDIDVPAPSAPGTEAPTTPIAPIG